MKHTNEHTFACICSFSTTLSIHPLQSRLPPQFRRFSQHATRVLPLPPHSPLYLSSTLFVSHKCSSGLHQSHPPPSNLYLGAMLAAPTHSHQAFQHHLPSVSYALTRRQPRSRNKTAFGRAVFVSRGVELSTQMIVSGPTTGADVKRRIEAFLFEFGTSERDLYSFLTYLRPGPRF